MITGTLMFDIEIEADNDAQVEEISKNINSAIKAVPGVTQSDKVDEALCDISED